MLTRIRALLTQGSLRGRTARGGMWLGGATAFDQFSRYARQVILARILAPSDFGLMSIIIAIMAAFESLTEVGIRACVIQSKEGATREFLNAAWWSSVLRGTVLAAAGIAAAPLVAWSYHRGEIVPLLRVATMAMFIRGLVSPRIHALEREMQYGRVAAINQGAGTLAVAATIVMSFYIRNVWALVAGYVLEAGTRTALSFAVAPFAPRLKVDWESVKVLSRYARGMVGLPVLMMVVAQVPILVLGKVRTIEEVPLYTFAAGLAGIPLTVFNAAIMKLMLPAFSKVQEDAARFKAAVLASIEIVALFGAPVTAFIIVFSKPLMGLSYGARYESGATALAILAVSTLVTMVNGNISNVFFARANPGGYRDYTLLRAVLLSAAIVPAAYYFGAAGTAAASLGALAAVFPIQMRGVRALVAVGGGDVARSAGYGLMLGGATLLASAAAYLAAGGRPWVSLGAGLVICAAAVAVASRKAISVITYAGKEPSNAISG